MVESEDEIMKTMEGEDEGKEAMMMLCQMEKVMAKQEKLCKAMRR